MNDKNDEEGRSDQESAKRKVYNVSASPPSSRTMEVQEPKSASDETENQQGLVGSTVPAGNRSQQTKNTSSVSDSHTTLNSAASSATDVSRSNTGDDGLEQPDRHVRSGQEERPSDENQGALSDAAQEQRPLLNSAQVPSFAAAAAPTSSFQDQSNMPAGLLQALMQSQSQMQPAAAASSLSVQDSQQQHSQMGMLGQMLLPLLAATGVPQSGAASQLQLVSALAQLVQQTSPHNDSSNETANAAIRAVMEAMPQLSNAPQIQQQVVQMLLQQQAEQQRRQQELEQQRQQEQQQQQLAALMGILQQQLQPVQQPVQNNALLQLGMLQQLLAAQSSSTSAPPPQANALLQALTGQAVGPPTPPPSYQDASSASAADSASLLQLLASTSNQMQRLPAAGNSRQVAGVARGINEISGSSDVSSDRSSMRGDNAKKQRTEPQRRRPSNVGRPINAFENRDPDGRAHSLPSLLVMPSDLVELSAHQTLLRYQIEVFQAGEEDVATHTRGRNKPVEMGQIGLRCRHCKILPVSERLRGSVYFPRAIEGFYQASQNMNSTHLQTGECQVMGDDLRQEFSDLITSRGTSTGAGRAYWAEQARNLGLSNTEDGIEFHPPENEV